MKLTLLSLTLLTFISSLFAQNDLCRKTTEGKDFWFGFMESRNYHDQHFVEITVTARESTTFKIYTGKEEKPVLVAQYSQSRTVDNSFTGGNGDPFMIILSSVTQSKSDVTFVAYDSEQIKKYYVNVITKTNETGNILLNGTTVQNQFSPFLNSNYSYAQISLNPGTYRLQDTNSEGGFLAYVYGFGGVESYGYGVGYNLNIILDLGKSINFDGDTLLLC